MTPTIATGDMATFESVRKPSRHDGTHCENCLRELRHDGVLWPAADLAGRGCGVHGTGGRHFRAFPCALPHLPPDCTDEKE